MSCEWRVVSCEKDRRDRTRMIRMQRIGTDKKKQKITKEEKVTKEAKKNTEERREKRWIANE